MIEIMKESQGKVVGFRASGKLTVNDYHQVLGPALNRLSHQFETFRALFYMDANFDGWELPAAWANTKLDVRYRGELEKVAVVGAPAWEEWCVRLARWVMKGELRTFPADRLNEAWDWIKS